MKAKKNISEKLYIWLINIKYKRMNKYFGKFSNIDVDVCLVDILNEYTLIVQLYDIIKS